MSSLIFIYLKKVTYPFSSSSIADLNRLSQPLSMYTAVLLCRLCHNCRCGKSASHLIDMNLDLLSWFSILNKNNKSLDPCDTVTLSTDLCNFYVVFLTCFHWFWIKASVKVSATCATVTSSVTHLYKFTNRSPNINALYTWPKNYRIVISANFNYPLTLGFLGLLKYNFHSWLPLCLYKLYWSFKKQESVCDTSLSLELQSRLRNERVLNPPLFDVRVIIRMYRYIRIEQHSIALSAIPKMLLEAFPKFNYKT